MKNLIASREQQKIIDLIGNNNLVVDSVAGSGKTTTNQFIALNYPQKNILLLTYNKRLKDETKTKFDSCGIKNVSIQTFHSFCYVYYLNQAIKDKEINEILNGNYESTIPFKFDIIIVDEAQDLTPTYFKLVLKICKENLSGQKFTLCIMGDQKQCINQYLQADSRFISMAEQIFKEINMYPWKRATLTTTFRLTKQMCMFINQNVLSNQRLVSKKVGLGKPRYLICDDYVKKEKKQNFRYIIKIAKSLIQNTNNNQNENSYTILKLIEDTQRKFQSVVLEVFYYLILGYQFEDIFILAPSLKTGTPASVIANDLSLHKIPILLQNSEDSSNELLFKNKIVFLSYNKSKGLERKVVIVLNFDEGYNLYYNKYDNTGVCSNAHYVALTRSSEQLTVVQFNTKKKLSFLNFSEQSENIQKIGVSDQQYGDLLSEENIYRKKVTPKNLIMHTPQNIHSTAYNYLSYSKQNGKGGIIEATTISEQQFKSFNFKQKEVVDIHEFVEDINETSVQAFFEICDKQNIYDCFIFSHIRTIEKQIGLFLTHQNILPKIREKFEQICLNKIDFNFNFPLQDLLFVSNYWSSIKNRQTYKLNQIQSYDWIDRNTLQSTLNRIYKVLDIEGMKDYSVSKFLQFQESHQLKENNLILETYSSFVSERKVWEVKFVKEILDTHLIQFSIQKYIFLMASITKLNSEIIAQQTKFFENPTEYFAKNSKVYYFSKNNFVKQGTFLHFSINLKNAFILTINNKRKAISRRKLIHPEYFENLDKLIQVIQDKYYDFKLLNVYDGAIYEEQTSLLNLEKMIKILIEYKYENKHHFEDDQQFLKTISTYRMEINI